MSQLGANEITSEQFVSSLERASAHKDQIDLGIGRIHVLSDAAGADQIVIDFGNGRYAEVTKH